MSSALRTSEIAGAVLAGGASRRFGGKSKAFQTLAGRPLIEHALRPLKGLKHIAISANQNEQELKQYGEAVLKDAYPDAGPLAGIHAALTWAQSLREVTWLATVAVDVPFLPGDLIARLAAEHEGVLAIVAATATNFSPVCALWSVEQTPLVAAALERGTRKMTDYLGDIAWHRVDVSSGPIDPLFNVNTPDTLAEAERAIAQMQSGRSV